MAASTLAPPPQAEHPPRSRSPITQLRCLKSAWRPATLLLFAALALSLTTPITAFAEVHIATVSIVARDPATGDLGVAVESKYFGIGSVVPHAQARGNFLYGPEGLDLLESGLSPELTLERLLADDPLRAQRQVGLVAAHERAASYTGNETLPWSGDKTGEHYFDGTGWELYALRRIRGNWWLTGGWNWLQPRRGQPLAGDYRIKFGVLGLRYSLKDFDRFLYVNVKADASLNADGSAESNVITAGIRWNF